MRSVRMLCFALGCVLISRVAAAAEPSLSTAKSLTFDGQTLDLAWEGGEPGSPIREYIPASEKLENWTHLASIREYTGREYDGLDDPRALAAKTLEMVQQNYPGAPTNMAENPDTGETVIDFLVGPPDGSFAEYNIFKYAKRPAGGIIAQQYAVRSYSNIDKFKSDELPTIRGRVINEMATDGLKPAK